MYSRDVAERASQVAADVVNVVPLLQTQRRSLGVVRDELRLVEQVLNDEHGSCQSNKLTSSINTRCTNCMGTVTSSNCRPINSVFVWLLSGAVALHSAGMFINKPSWSVLVAC